MGITHMAYTKHNGSQHVKILNSCKKLRFDPNIMGLVVFKPTLEVQPNKTICKEKIWITKVDVPNSNTPIILTPIYGCHVIRCE